MINYQSVKNILTSEKYADKTECFEDFIGFKHTTLENCKATGSSLFIKSLAYFLDKTIDARDIFSKLNIGKSPVFDKEINSYQVVWLDFSDFNAQNFKEAEAYLRKKMSDVYKYFYDLFKPERDNYYDYCTFEYALDIIEQKSSTKQLQYSPYYLLRQLKGHDASYHNSNKLALLIDNLIRIETIAKEKNYETEMNQFLRAFIVEDIYKHCDMFLQIGDEKEERDNRFVFNQNMAYHNFYAMSYDIHDRYKSLIVEREKQYNFIVEPYRPEAQDWNAPIANGRRHILQAKRKEEQKQQERIRHEIEKYAKELSPNVPLLSPNFGIRSKHLDKSTDKYSKLNELLKRIYEHTKPQTDTASIYQYLQGIDSHDILINDAKEYESLLKDLTARHPKWKEAWTSVWSGWIQVTYTNKADQSGCSPANSSNIKVYVCIKDKSAPDVFIESIKYLLNTANNTFAAKIGSYRRNDQICYWVSPEDFKHLEAFYAPLSDNLTETMPFMAYRNKLGISKDFTGPESSHNSTMAHIISDYLKTEKSTGQTELESMYNNYIAKWNADICEENDCDSFKRNSALSFVVIMDTLDIILNDVGIPDDSLFLSADKDLWHKLSSSYCWADVNDKFK